MFAWYRLSVLPSLVRRAAAAARRCKFQVESHYGVTSADQR